MSELHIFTDITYLTSLIDLVNIAASNISEEKRKIRSQIKEFDQYKQYLQDKNITHSIKTFFTYSCQNRFISSIKLITRYFVMTETHYIHTLPFIVDSDDIEFINWYITFFNITLNQFCYNNLLLFHILVNNDKFYVMQWIIELFNINKSPNTNIFDYIIDEYVIKGNLNAIIWLNDKFDVYNIYSVNDFILHRFYTHAAINGHLHIIVWLYDKFGIVDIHSNYDEIFRYSAENGHMDILVWLNNTFNYTYHNVVSDNNYAFRHASKNGHLHVMVWLINTFNLTHKDVIDYHNYAIKFAFLNTHYFVVRWLLQTYKLYDVDYSSVGLLTSFE